MATVGTRLGDFSLLEDLGRSAAADRYKAMHVTQGGPFFLKVYARLDRRLHGELQRRCDVLIGQEHANLVPHLGHGVVDGAPFVVAPYLPGIDLREMSSSLLDRRVFLGLDGVLLVLADLATAVGALHAAQATHGDVSVGHVRLGADGEIWLTGLTTPRNEPGASPSGLEPRWDLAGVGALTYDLVPLLRGGAARPPLPAPLDGVVRRALGIGPVADHLAPFELVDRLREVGQQLKLKSDRAAFAELVRRTMRAVERRLAESAPVGNATKAPVPSSNGHGEPHTPARPRRPADGIPALDPVERLPVLEPVAAKTSTPTKPTARPAPVPDFDPPTEVTLRPRSDAARERSSSRPAAPAAAPVADPFARADTLPGLPAPSAPAAPPPRPPAASRATAAPPMPGPFDDATVQMERRAPRTSEATGSHARAPAGGSASDETRDGTDPDRRIVRAEQLKKDPALRALIARRLVSEAAVAAAIEEHVARGGRVAEILVASGALSDADVAQALAEAAGRTRIQDDDLKKRSPPAALVRRLPQTYVLARRVLPLSLDNGLLTVAVADPFEQATLDELRNLLGAAEVEPFVAARAAITAMTVEAYRSLGIGGVPGTGSAAVTVLLCTTDDGKATRIGARLAQEGLRVEHVVMAAAAQEILATRPPDVVLCAHDLGVPALVLFARAQPRTAEVPFFVFGPRGDDELATRVLDLGADDYFPEPLKLEMLLAKVRRMLGKRFGADASGVHRAPAAAASAPPTGPSAAPPMELDERTPPQPNQLALADRLATGRQPAVRHEPSFLENIALPSLDDLPELPPGFDDEQAAPETPPAMPTGVMGTLRQMALPEIVQSLEMGRKTARVDLVPAEGDKGMIAFEAGQIRYAECGALRGDDAFYQLARHSEGFFRIHYGDKPPATNIEHPTTFLLLEAMRRMDEEGLGLDGGS